jgi:hypothetical protein
VFIPQKVADRLREYSNTKKIGEDQRVFSISYTAGRRVVNKAGKVVGIHLRPHDLRRHAATYASRSGVPIEIVSKVILRHANLSTTQRYPSACRPIPCPIHLNKIHCLFISDRNPSGNPDEHRRNQGIKSEAPNHRGISFRRTPSPWAGGWPSSPTAQDA